MTTPTEDSGHGESELPREQMLALAQRASGLLVKRLGRPSDGPPWRGWTHVRETLEAIERPEEVST